MPYKIFKVTLLQNVGLFLSFKFSYLEYINICGEFLMRIAFQGFLPTLNIVKFKTPQILILL